MKLLRNTALGLSLSFVGASVAVAGSHGTELTIAIVNNGHTISMQSVAEA